jgi:hypothetical protein
MLLLSAIMILNPAIELRLREFICRIARLDSCAEISSRPEMSFLHSISSQLLELQVSDPHAVWK